MKKLTIVMAALLSAVAMQAKNLVAYYSYTNNVERIVTALKSQIDVDVIEIEPAEKGLDYAANNYALGTQLLNAIRNNPNDAASYPARYGNHRLPAVVEPDGRSIPDFPFPLWPTDGGKEHRSDSVKCQQRHKRRGG